MKDLSAYDAIIFDMDGTLVDSMGSHLKAWEQVCIEYGYPFDYDYMHSLGGVPTKATVALLNDQYGLNHDPDEIAIRKHQFWLAMDHDPTPIAETFAVFEHYHGKMPIGVGTGAERSHAEELLAKHGLLPRLGALVTASDVTHGKPHPETFVSVALQLGVDPTRCVVFEDTDIGRRAAIAGGMDCIMVKNGKIQP